MKLTKHSETASYASTLTFVHYLFEAGKIVAGGISGAVIGIAAIKVIAECYNQLDLSPITMMGMAASGVTLFFTAKAIKTAVDYTVAYGNAVVDEQSSQMTNAQK